MTLWAEEKLKLEPIPLSDELFGKELNGEQIKHVRCRRPKADGKGVDPEYRLLAPALEGIEYNGRWVVIYSRYDLGCALEQHHVVATAWATITTALSAWGGRLCSMP